MFLRLAQPLFSFHFADVMGMKIKRMRESTPPPDTDKHSADAQQITTQH